MTLRHRFILAAVLSLVFCFWAPGPNPAAKDAVSAAAIKTENAEMLDRLKLFADVLAVVRNEYVEDVDDADLIDAALNGALNSLDPHSSYVPPVKFEEQKEAARGEYGGLGIEVIQENNLVKINYALEDAPAYKAGIRTGDYITAVEGERTFGKTLDEAIEGMKGLAGDPVTVTVLTPDNITKDVVVIRQVVRRRAVRHRVEKGQGYVFLETFNNERLTDDLELALKDIKRQLGVSNIPGLIIDLRGNRGGLLTESVSVSGLFLDGGEVLSARGRTSEDTERYHAEDGQFDKDMRIVVLIDSGSASAAEIVAGALQDRGRAVVVGRRSFGKGSVQSVMPLAINNGALRLTTQKYYTPSGKSIQGRGIMPDVLVALSPDTGTIRKQFREASFSNALSNADMSAFEEDHDTIDYPPEDWPRTEDYQLQKALDIIRSSRHTDILSKFEK
ncbi:S41 family peptidase [Fretibacter rubidus]|uniref:S41 family peptidase n=1 Tax=Fretibacter rubidus TaxID=570162 RepID=UPI00352B3544